MTSAAHSLSVVEGPSGPFADLSRPEAESALSEVREAYAQLALVREREARCKSIVVEMVLDARAEGHKLAEIAAAMNVSRQYVAKLIREALKSEAEDEAFAQWSETQARKAERDALAGLGFTARDRQCGVCHRFKSAPSSVCEYCGDDPVTHNGERRDYDASYAGGIR